MPISDLNPLSIFIRVRLYSTSKIYCSKTLLLPYNASSVFLPRVITKGWTLGLWPMHLRRNVLLNSIPPIETTSLLITSTPKVSNVATGLEVSEHSSKRPSIIPSRPPPPLVERVRLTLAGSRCMSNCFTCRCSLPAIFVEASYHYEHSYDDKNHRAQGNINAQILCHSRN